MPSKFHSLNNWLLFKSCMYECRAMLNNSITSRFRITYYIFYQMLKLFASWFCRNTGKSLRIFFFRWQFQRSETNRTPALDEPKKAPLEVPLSVSHLEQTHPAFYSLSPPAYTAIPDVTSGNQSGGPLPTKTPIQ